MLILLTNKCNLSCKHCMQKGSPENTLFMDEKVYQTTLYEAHRLGARVLNIAGGEPTILDTNVLKNYLILALSLDFIVVLETNGYFLDDEEKTKMLTEMALKYSNFYIQISAFKEYYANREQVLDKFRQRKFAARKLQEAMKYRLSISDEGNVNLQLMALGRCEEGKMLEKAKKFDRYPSCINSALIMVQSDLSKQLPCSVLENCAKFCVPMVDPNGDMHMGESIFCKKICNIADGKDKIIEAMANYKPCGRCLNYHWHFDNPSCDKDVIVKNLLNL